MDFIATDDPERRHIVDSSIRSKLMWRLNQDGKKNIATIVTFTPSTVIGRASKRETKGRVRVTFQFNFAAR